LLRSADHAEFGPFPLAEEALPFFRVPPSLLGVAEKRAADDVCDPVTMIDCIFVNGTVGAGKSSVAIALGRMEESAGHSHAVIDLDHLRWAWPAPSNDPFNHELELRNLAAIAHNYREAGVDHLIVAGVLERRSEVTRYRDALQAKHLLACRLEARSEILAARLRLRHSDDEAELSWHLARAGELANILSAANVDDLVFDSSDLRAKEVARLVSDAAAWS
jgi:adenylylsulfate kinase-like enzyme